MPGLVVDGGWRREMGNVVDSLRARKVLAAASMTPCTE